MQPARTARAVLPSLLLLALVAVACGAPGGRTVSQMERPAAAVATEPAAVGLDVPSDAAQTEPADPTAQGLPVPGEATPSDEAATAAPAAPPPDAAPPAAVVPVSQAVEARLAQLTLEQRVGQLFSVAVFGDDATNPSEAARRNNTSLYGVATPAEVVRRFHLGGVAYFAHDLGPGTSNVADLSRTAQLSAGLQSAAAAGSGVGLLIGADQEGGNVVRLRAPATVFPAAREIGDLADQALAFDVGQVTGTEARALGINWVYAPVADVNVNPGNPVIGPRAFGVAEQSVTPMVTATAQGLAAGGVLPTAKHYPGHGDTTIDSHSSLPTIDHTVEQLSQIDLPPFAAAAQLERISVMVGHLAVPSLDPSGRPATISPAIMSVLRDQIGFQGLVVTDAMNMGALSGFGGPGDLAVQAVAAGVDVVLMPTDLPAAYGAVLARAQADESFRLLVDNAVRRVLAAKEGLGILDAATVTAAGPAALGTPEHEAVRERLRARCGC